MGRAAILWFLGVPIPVLLLMWVLGWLHWGLPGRVEVGMRTGRSVRPQPYAREQTRGSVYGRAAGYGPL